MNINPINNAMSFGGKLTIQNLKNNTTQKILTSSQTDEKLLESITSVANNRMNEFVPNAEGCLNRLKDCVKQLSDLTGGNFAEKLDYPEIGGYSVYYRTSGKDAEIKAPEYFTITLEG